MSPFPPSQGLLASQFYYLVYLGRVDEARRLLPRFEAGLALEAPMVLAAVAGQWSAAESLAKLSQGARSADLDTRRKAAAYLAAAQSSRGQVGIADQTLRQAQSMAASAGQPLRATSIRWDRLRLALFSRGWAADPGSPGDWDTTSTTGLVTRGAWAAATGDTTLARALLAAARTRSAPDLARQGSAPALLEAWIAARRGRWNEVIQVLGPSALQGESKGYVVFQSAPLDRWLVAEAYERLDRPDSAAVYFERAIAPMPDGGTNFEQIWMASSFAHSKLVHLYARMGRLEEARRHWELFATAFTQADPEMQPLIEDTRAALASAESVARSARH